MTIAPLPTSVATTSSAGPSGSGSSGAGAGSTGSTGSSADVFATLVEAVLGATTGLAGDTALEAADPVGPATGDGLGTPFPPAAAASPGTAHVAAAMAVSGLSVAADDVLPGTTDALAAAADEGLAGAEPGTAVGAEPGADASTAADAAALAGAVATAVPLPVAAPALAAALGLSPLTTTPPATSAVSGDSSTDPAPAPVDHAPLPTTPAAGGAPSTGPAPAPVDHAPLPTAPTVSGAPSTEPAPAPVDHPPLTPAAPRPTDEPAPGRHADGTTVEAGRMTSAGPEGAEGHGQGTDTAARTTPRTAEAPGPTLVQGSPASQATPSVDATQAPTRAAEAAPTTQVTRSAAAQVVPELTRLVQAGPGTHRMVLRLDPEHLGDVRITLTVHPGGVRVRMATGSEDARVALSDGLPELQRALGAAAGRPAGETQVAVLHQARPDQGTTYDGGAPSTQTDAGQASDHQTPGDRPQAGDRDAGRPARTQVDTTARDGSQGAGTPRPADPPTSSRSARLDVSM